MLRIVFNSLIALAATLVSGAASAQVSGPSPPLTINGWTYSTIESNVQVTGISQVLESNSDSTGQTYEKQHVAYSHDQGLVRYATRASSNGGAWTASWILHPWALICSDPSLAVDNTGRPFIHCIDGDKVKVGWRQPSGVVTTGYVDFDAVDARAGTVALRMNTDGSLRAIHVVYQKRGPTGSRIVAHRYCTTFPMCEQPSDWKGLNEEFPLAGVLAAKVPLISSSSTTVEVAVLQGGKVWFGRWNAIGGWDTGSFTTPGTLAGADEVVFKRNAYGKIAAVSTASSVYAIDWNEQGYPYRYHKVSGGDVVDPDNHFDVVRTSPGSVSVVYQRDDTDDLVLARRGPLDTWSREVVASQGNTGRLPRVDRDLYGRFLITYWDATDAKLRSVYR